MKNVFFFTFVTGDGVREEGNEEDDQMVPGSVRLLAEWVRRAADDGDFRGRFKGIGDVVNADEVALENKEPNSSASSFWIPV